MLLLVVDFLKPAFEPDAIGELLQWQQSKVFIIRKSRSGGGVEEMRKILSMATDSKMTMAAIMISPMIYFESEVTASDDLGCFM